MPPRKTALAPLIRKAQRTPQQNRGEVRVVAILDACERLLVGDDSTLTMHGVAAEAQTSIGSLYHFFPDKQSLLEALAERHQAAAKAIAHAIDAVSDDTWRAATPEQLVDLLLKPLLNYVASNPALFPLLRFQRSAGKSPAHLPVQATLDALCLRVISLRLPEASEVRRRAYAATLLGLPFGLITDLMVDYDEPLRGTVLSEEIPRALVAYLYAIGIA